MTNIIIKNVPDQFERHTILDLMKRYGEVYTCECRSCSSKGEPGSVIDTKTVTCTWYIKLINCNQTIPPVITLGKFHIDILVENSFPDENEYRNQIREERETAKQHQIRKPNCHSQII